jgi:hypothetical protein
MKTFNKPTNLNGAELQKELLDSGIIVDKIFDNGNNTISFKTDNEELAADIVSSHNGTVVVSLNARESALAKLTALGLTEEEIATLSV